MSAVVAATPYQNPTGADIDVNVPVEFRGHESSDDEDDEELEVACTCAAKVVLAEAASDCC